MAPTIHVPNVLWDKSKLCYLLEKRWHMWGPSDVVGLQLLSVPINIDNSEGSRKLHPVVPGVPHIHQPYPIIVLGYYIPKLNILVISYTSHEKQQMVLLSEVIKIGCKNQLCLEAATNANTHYNFPDWELTAINEQASIDGSITTFTGGSTFSHPLPPFLLEQPLANCLFGWSTGFQNPTHLKYKR